MKEREVVVGEKEVRIVNCPSYRFLTLATQVGAIFRPSWLNSPVIISDALVFPPETMYTYSNAVLNALQPSKYGFSKLTPGSTLKLTLEFCSLTYITP